MAFYLSPRQMVVDGKAARLVKSSAVKTKLWLFQMT